MVQLPHLLLAEIDMTKPYEQLGRKVVWLQVFQSKPLAKRPRPTEEPPSPANAIMGMTFIFVIVAFVVPLLLLGMKSQNTDIASKDEALAAQDIAAVKSKLYSLQCTGQDCFAP